MNYEQNKPSQTSDYEMKTIKNEDYNISLSSNSDCHKKSANCITNSYTAMFFKKSIEEQNKNKEENFKKRLEEFRKIGTKNEAVELANKIMPVKNERTVFTIGKAKCIVINREKLFRITYISDAEFISFNFQ